MKKLLLPFAAGLGLAVALVVFLGTDQVVAAPTALLMVDTYVDDADGECGLDCTLREAIIAANESGEADTIILPEGTFTLTLVGTEDLGVSGDLDIRGNYGLTIAGQGAGKTIINAAGIDRVFDVRPGVPTVVFSGVTIYNGQVSSPHNGGGIFNYDSDLWLIDTDVVSNAGRSGGGIYVAGGNVTLNGGRIISNVATGIPALFNGGGGVYVAGANAAFTQTGASAIEHNVAQSEGGGLYVQYGRATLNGGQVFSNTAVAYDGGGVFVYTNTLVLNGGEIIDNYGRHGGGVYASNGGVIMDGGQIVDNVAWSTGGGVGLGSGTSRFIQSGPGLIARNTTASGGGIHGGAGRVELDGVEIVSNTATFDAGGVYVGQGSLQLLSGQIATNTAVTRRGGGVLVHMGDAILEGGLIMGNEADDEGGGINVRYGRVTLAGARVVSNTAQLGGGVYVYDAGAAFTQTGSSEIAHNVAPYGGGVAVDVGTVTLAGGQVAHNVAGSGGGAYVSQSGGKLVQIGGSIITNVVEYYGGGVYVDQGSVAVSGGQIADNSATLDGGGVYVHRGGVTLSGGEIVSNVATVGGGVCVGLADAGFTQTGAGAVSYNRAITGGGVSVYTGTYGLAGGQVWSNTADVGGGLYVARGGVTLSGGQIIDNYAIDGGGVCIASGSVVQSGGEITGNTAARSGGGIFLMASSAAFTQTTGGVIAHNVAVGTSAAEGGGGVFLDVGRLVVSGGQILGNSVSGLDSNGGGMYLNGGDVVVVAGQVISNTASRGGGFYNRGGGLTLINTTVSGNDAGIAGGLWNDAGGTSVLTYTTVASNSSGIRRQAGTVLVKNTIVAYNTGGNCQGQLTSHGHNLEDGTGCGFNATGDISNTTSTVLGPLTYDTSTWVHPLVAGSQAVDNGLCIAGVTTDQRGFSRPEYGGTACDMGAYEYTLGQPKLAIAKVGTPAAVVSGDPITYVLTISNSGTISASLLVITDVLPAGAGLVGASHGGLLAGGVVSWTVDSLDDGDALTRTFTVTAGETITNQAYGVVDQDGEAVSGVAVVTTYVNHPPVVDAGGPQQVPVGALVRLDGSGTVDSDGDALTYGWSQTGGTVVSLIDGRAISPTFPAPATAGVLTFTLAVTDSFGTVRSDVTTVTVRNVIFLPLVLRNFP